MSRRRLLLAFGLAPVLALSAAPAPSTARAATSPAIPFDAYIASGDASCVELTVNIAGYSFVVEPDIRLPRATSTISEGQASALAAPVDPGDSVDALAGLTVPREEGTLASGIDSALAQSPLPVPGDPGNAVVQALNPFNRTLEFPIEHASATYPQPGSASDQQATYLGASNLAVDDPSGLLSLDGTAGSARAGPQSASADAGAGSALSVSLLGVSVGRIAAHAQSQVGSSSVTNDVSCTLGDVTIAPPGAGYSFHINSLTASLHTERALRGRTATSTPALHLDGVSVTQMSGGQAITTDLSPTGSTVSVPSSLASVAVPQLPALPLPPPLNGLPVSLESLGLSGTSTTSALSSHNNEMTSTLTAATLSMQTTIPVPTSIPTGPPPCLTNPQQILQCLPSLVPTGPGGGLPITSAPATYTLQFGSLDSTTYGFTASPEPAFSGGVGTGGGAPIEGAPVTGSAGTGTPGSPGTPGTRPVSATLTVPGIPASIRWPVVALAGLLEALLLTVLFVRRRAALRARIPGPPPESFVDMP
ncbi:MAG TPA: hypothetical protein VF155_01895 [Candidatus Dormibacteraeota bacterium]